MRRGALLCGLAALALPAAAHAAGCGRIVPPGPIAIAVTVDGRTRPLQVHVPAGYDADRPAPLLFDLHGSGGDGAGQARVSGLDRTADARGVLVAHPDGGIALERGGFAWNVPGVPTVAGTVPGPDDADDTRYLVAAIDAIGAQLCVDRARVYATGLSGGGRMSSWLGCAASDRIAAIAPVVGLRAGRARANAPDEVDPATCTPARAMPVLTFAGLRDATNPVAGGEGPRWGYSMARALQRWATINGCQTVRPTRWLDARRYAQAYAGCRDGSAVEAIVDVEGGHDWGVADNERMLDFLLRYRLANLVNDAAD